jgi:hypothetical protein
VKSRAFTCRFFASTIVGDEGPTPRPSSPWHFAHCIFA